jgi:gliding motility-associated-like protein
MKKLSLLITALVSVVALWSQAPVNDDCAGLIDLGSAPVCPPDTFTNQNATNTNIGFDNNPSCFNGNLAGRDVWFAFTCPDTLFDFRITVTGVGSNGILNPQFAVYRGDCQLDGLAELLCAVADVGEKEVFLDIQGLTPNLQYFIRVSDFSVTGSPNDGDFTLCITPIPPSNTVDEGGSTLCSGTLYDSGGPDGDYGPNENHTFVICPNQPNACINFTLTYFNIENGFSGDILTFYDGDGTAGIPITQISGSQIPQYAVAGGGGVCYQVQATSGCLTVQFQSGNINEFEGFEGHWQCSTQPCPPPAPLDVIVTPPPSVIVDAITTPLTTVTVTDINCPNGGYGTFSFPTDNNELGLTRGLILSSGQADLAIGPNTLTSTGFDNDGLGDPDLDFLSVQQGNGTLSNDACIVELDVFVNTDELVFEYVFGSDEYPEFVNTNFNDIFAFLVSGPGITGDPGLGGAKNIAIIPGSNTPVQINSVNNLLNWEYYRNTEISQVLEYDGITSDFKGVKKSLTARTDVIPCNTYHLKLAVADRFDFIYDSGVFISEIKAGTPDLFVQFAGGIDYFIEDCSGNEDQLVIALSEPASDTTAFSISIGGTAEQNADYVLNLPADVIFLPGQQQLSFPIFPIADGIQEGTETITITLSNNYGCGTVQLKTVTIEIKDNVDVSVNGGADTLFVCQGGALQLQAEGATNYFWSPPGAVSNPFIANPTITPTQSLWLQITGTVASCTDVDSVYLSIIDPQVDAVVLGDSTICQGASVQLQAVNNTGDAGIAWTPVGSLNDPASATPIATPTTTTTYVATLSIAGCSVSDSVKILVDTLFLPQLNFTDTTVCQNYPVQLAEVLTTTTTYDWSPELGLSDPNTSGPVALPDQSTTYTLTAGSANAYCTSTLTVNVNVIAADVDITGEPYREICLGDTVLLFANTAPAGNVVQWSPAFAVSNSTGSATSAVPDESITLSATYIINGCLVRDSVQIRVDSLPLQDIRREEDKAVYCIGDTVYLISPTYEPANFPDIEQVWLPFGEQVTPDSNWNLVIVATETHTYQRITINRACVDTAEVQVPVTEPPTINVTANPSKVCPGESVQLNATVEPNQTLEWQEDPSLSCTDCPNPIAVPFATTQYSVSAPEADCPASASVTIQVIPPPALNLAQSQIICLGESVVLNSTNQPNVTYTWTSIPAGFSSSEPNPVVAPTVTTTYKVVAVNADTCVSEGEVTLTVAAATVSTSPDQIICLGDAATLTAEQTGTPGQFNWQPGNQNTASIQVSPTVTTIYTVRLSFGDDCTALDSVVVSVFPAPVIAVAQDTALCLGGTVNLNLAPAEPGVTYSWSSTPAGFTSTQANPTLAPTQTTTYRLVADNSVCQRSDEISVTVADATLNAGPDQTICFGETTSVTAVTTGTPGNFAWSPDGQTTASITITPVVTQVYRVVYTYGPGCIKQDSMLLTVVPAVALSQINAVPDTSTLCEGTALQLSVTVVPTDAVLVWTENDVVVAGQTDTLINVVPTVSPGETVEYKVTATDDNGCSASAGPVSFLVAKCYVIPNAFTPNGDSTNDQFGVFVTGGEIDVVSFRIYNRWGQQVFEASGGNKFWDGRVDNKEAPSDVYVFVMQLRFPDGREETVKGDVTLIR